jgi:hypothetical protein
MNPQNVDFFKDMANRAGTITDEQLKSVLWCLGFPIDGAGVWTVADMVKFYKDKKIETVAK